MRQIEIDYRDYLDEVWPEVQVGPYTYGAGQALYDLDPIAFRVGMADWLAEKEDN